MFLVPPKIPFLPNNTETQKLLCFGDPNNLKDGIILKEKKSRCEKIIYSLYDMDMDTKYITEQGHTVRRISESQVVVKKKAAPVPSNAEKATVTAMSNPINIPSAPNSFRHGSFLAKRSLNRNSSSADSESHSHSHSHSDPVSESIGSFGKFGTSPLSPSFEDFDFLPARAPKHKEQEENYQSHSFKIVVDIQTPNVPGEKIERITEDVILVKSNNRNVQGTLYLTNYQLIFSPLHKMDETNHNTPFFMDEKPSINNDDLKSDTIMLPLTTILKFEKVDRQNGTFMFGGDNSYAIDLFTKDFRRTIRLELDPKGNSRVVLCDLLAKYIYPRSIGDIFATSSGYKPPDTGFNGWELYDATTEYTRMGLGDEKSGWTLNTINSNYTLSDTYPQTLVVPIGLTEEDLISVAQFRSKGRIPVLAWRNKHTGVSLCRCSQPRTGMSRSYRCKADEKLIRCIQHMNRHSAKLHIMDARPMTNAIANMALGGGYENISYYPDCELEFLGIANIHSVRDSWNKLRDLCDLQGGDEAKSNSSSWLSQLENTHWFDHLLSILTGAVRIAQLIDKQKESVLIHCSDGWDRTPQVCSLAQLLLDRDYRTIKGFCILIEKEWLHFGHKFADRCGLSFEDPAYKDAERSPIFLQFLDAVWQIMQQFPWSFEFNENLLVTIMEHLYSSRFGTFLMNTDKERKESKLQEISSSLWTYILYNNNNNNNNNNNYYINPFYQPHKEPIVLNPSLDIKNLQFWKSYYLKYITLDCENSNHYIRIGREMRDTIQSLMCDVDILQKENELLVQELKLLKDASAKAAKTELHNKNKNNNNNNNNGAPIKFSKDHKNPSSLLIRENLSCDWIDIENGSGNEN